MSKAGTCVLIGAASLALYACAKKEAPTINASMTGIMEPKAEKVWEIVSGAYNDVGDGLVASKISDHQWKEVADATAAMKERAQYLATAPHVVVAKANEPILGSQAVGQKGDIGKDWEAVGAATIQARIDANPDGFRKKAQALVDAADAMNRAAQTRDAALLYKVSSELDEVCDSCHEPFWGTDEPPPFTAKSLAKATGAR